MHKWWARRSGAVFRTICLYSLLTGEADETVFEPGKNTNLSDYADGSSKIRDLISEVDREDPESLWNLFTKDVRVPDKKILDPFVGGGTSIVEASRFGVDTVGYDLSPVAWFITKKQLDAASAEKSGLKSVFSDIKTDVADELQRYYKTSCPIESSHTADVMYYFWVRELDCVSCQNTVPLFRDYRVAKGRYENDDKYNVYCPSCDSVILVDDWQSECTCSSCSYEFVPKEGNVSRGDYTCPDCGQKYGLIDAVQEQGGYETRQYGVEYYCSECDEEGRARSSVKGYKRVESEDRENWRDAKEEWDQSNELNEYIPDTDIPLGIMTDSTEFSGSIGGGHNILRHGFETWADFYNERQLLCLSTLLRRIDQVENQNTKELLLLAFSESLNFNSTLNPYQAARNHTNHLFKTNAFDTPTKISEGNLWGTKYGIGTFQSTWSMILKAVDYAKAPTDRYVVDGNTEETPPFGQPIGENSEVYQGDMRTIEATDEFDAVITDPPYYDNVLYSEISEYYYAWLRLILGDEYDCFTPEHTPRKESIVANPALEKGPEEFESELHEAFSVIRNALKEDGVLTFTYHHSDSESWGELLESLCDVGFEVTATYPISADAHKFIGGEAVEFDIIIVARPVSETTPTSWNSLRRNVYRTAQKTRNRLEGDREISRGDIGVIEMGECFHEYSKHHGKVMRAGETMSAKEVVKEIYGIIQQGSDIGEIDVFLDLLEISDPTYNDLNKLTRGNGANPDKMESMCLYHIEGGDFVLGTWQDGKRMAYIQERVNGDGAEALTSLDKAQFLRYRYEQGKTTHNYLEKWGVSDDLRELCEGLAEATGDEVYTRILGGDQSLGNF